MYVTLKQTSSLSENPILHQGMSQKEELSFFFFKTVQKVFLPHGPQSEKMHLWTFSDNQKIQCYFACSVYCFDSLLVFILPD